jgi:hypothetical protein
MAEFTLHVCANLAREAAEALRARGLAGVRVAPFAPACDGRPRPGPPPVLDPGDVAVGGPCLAVAAPEAGPHQRLSAPTCFHLLEAAGRVDTLLREGAFLVTPGWLARWRAWLEQGGFGQASARLLFAECARRVVLLDTGVDARAPEALQDFAAFVGLPAERLPVPLERLGLLLAEAVQRRRADRAEQRVADHALALETLASLPPTAGEAAVAAALAELARRLCGAGRTVFWPARPDQPPRPGPPAAFPGGAACAAPEEEARALDASEDGFVVRVGPAGGETGWLAVAELRFPAQRERYRQLVAVLAQAGHLALRNARQLRGFIPICSGCNRIRDERGAWSRVDEYIAARSEAIFTHSLCPECLERLYPEP